MKPGSLTLALAGIALALAVPVANAETLATGTMAQLAQAQDGDRAGHDEKTWHERHRQHLQQMCETADARHAAALAFSETRIKLTEAQKPAWRKFVEASSAAHQSKVTLLCTDIKDSATPSTLPERLARAEQTAQLRLETIRTTRPALDELYKLLTPEQQKIADTLPLFGSHRHHHGSHHWQRG